MVGVQTQNIGSTNPARTKAANNARSKKNTNDTKTTENTTETANATNNNPLATTTPSFNPMGMMMASQAITALAQALSGMFSGAEEAENTEGSEKNKDKQHNQAYTMDSQDMGEDSEHSFSIGPMGQGGDA